jgi:hypothetical protein
MDVGRFIRAIRVEAGLAAVAYVGLLVVARPRVAAAALDLPAWPWANRLFSVAVVVAMLALGCLALRLWGRLFAAGARVVQPASERATAGTVITEFALVFPLVLLVMCMIIQLALIANASIVVRYAAFSAARSAIVSFEAETRSDFSIPPSGLPPALQFPPFPEWVDKERPEHAARLTLAALSPQTNSSSVMAASMEDLLQQQGGVWQGRNFATRYEYASAATRVSTIRDVHGGFAGWYETFPRLMPVSPNMITPYGQSQGDDQFFIPVPPPPRIPNSVTVQFPPLNVQIGPITIPIQLPLSFTIPLPGGVINPLNQLIRNLFNAVRGGGQAAYDFLAESPANIDPLSPKEVEITVEYDFVLTLPGLNFVPTLTRPTPIGNGQAFRISHTVKLQSTGGRKANAFAFIPTPKQTWGSASGVRENTPLFWVWPD